MIRPFRGSLVLGLVAMAAASSALSAQNSDKNAQQMAALYDKISLAINGGKVVPDRLVSLRIPGMQISEGFSHHNDEEKKSLMLMFDEIPGVGQIYYQTGKNYSQVYLDVLEHTKVPKVALEKEEPKDLVKALELTDPDGPVFQNYLLYQGKFLEASAAKDTAELELANAQAEEKFFSKIYPEAKVIAMNAEEKTAYNQEKKEIKERVKNANSGIVKIRADYSNAKTVWEGKAGSKNAVESAIATIKRLSAKDSGNYWKRLHDRFDDGLKQNGAYYDVQFFPSADTWNAPQVEGKADPSWMKFKFTGQDATSTSYSGSKAAEMEGSYKKASTSVTASASWSKAIQNSMAQDESFSIEFELKKVAVFRPWMEQAVFANKNWWFTGLSKDNILSFGRLNHPNINQALLPLVMDTIILARNIVIHAKFDQKTMDAYQQAIAAKLDVSVGPFSFAGGYSQKDDGKKETAKMTGSEISCPGVQILGYISRILEPSPSRGPDGKPK